MAIVPNKASEVVARDASYCTPNREHSGNPNGTITPLYAGERLLDTSGNLLWEALGIGNDSWVSLTS